MNRFRIFSGSDQRFARDCGLCSGALGLEFRTAHRGRTLRLLRKLALNPGLGHRREDLTPQPFHFFTKDPYLIVYVRDETPVSVMRVLHGARNIKKILRTRPRD